MPFLDLTKELGWIGLEKLPHDSMIQLLHATRVELFGSDGFGPHKLGISNISCWLSFFPFQDLYINLVKSPIFTIKPLNA